MLHKSARQLQAQVSEVCVVVLCCVLSPCSSVCCQSLSSHDRVNLALVALKRKPSQRAAISPFSLFDYSMLGKSLYK